MNFERFIKLFNDWRANNGYPNRDECREVFRQYRNNRPNQTETSLNDWREYVFQTEKPAMFLDSLFSKKGPSKEYFVERKTNNEKDDILVECYEYIKANNLIPTFSDLSSQNVKKIFETEDKLLEELKNKYQDLSTYILNENSFDANYNRNVIKKIKNYNRYVITTAVSNKKVNNNFLKSINNYAEKNEALVLVLPCMDVASRKTNVKWQLDPALKDFCIIYNDTFLNDNLMISDIKTSAKHIHPTQGLDSFCREKSVIMASPKQELKYNPDFIGRHPNALMTTGAITLPDYSTDLFMSKRTSKLAEHDHITGAIVVELEDNKIFHFRQIQADKEGNICDLGFVYKPDNTTCVDNNVSVVFGDLHAGFGDIDQNIFEAEMDISKYINAKSVVLHDICSCSSVSHWTKDKTVTKAIQANGKQLSLEEEANKTADTLKRFEDFDDIYIVRSNHDKFLLRYLENGDYAKDSVNLYYSLDIVKAMIEGKDPFEFMIKQKTVFKDLKGKRNKYHFLKKYENKSINSTEIASHGNAGCNGSKGNEKIFNKAFTSAVIGHTHSASIHRGIFTVGTTTRKDLDYITDGLSTWTHTCGIIHSNGTKQLINIIKTKSGEYKWRI